MPVGLGLGLGDSPVLFNPTLGNAIPNTATGHVALPFSYFFFRYAEI